MPLGFLSRLAASGAALWIVAGLFDDIYFDSWVAAVVAAVALGVINMFVRPVLQVLALPVTIFTLGIFALVINAVLLLVTSELVAGFHVEGFDTAFWGSIMLAIVNGLIHGLFRDDRD